MKTKILLILISFLSISCEDELLKNKPHLPPSYEDYPKYEELKLSIENFGYSYYSKDSSFCFCENIPDSSIILGLTVAITNVTSSKIISFVTMSCSYYGAFKVKNNETFICGHPCWANFPETVELLPKDQKEWNLQIIIPYSVKQETQNLELCFEPHKELSKLNEKIYPVCSKPISIIMN